MKKTYSIIVLMISLAAFSCKPIKKAEKVQKQIARQDTSKIVIVHATTQSPELDTLQNTLASLDSSKIKGFSTFSGKAKVDYNNGNSSQSFSVSIHIREDSAIWISATGLLGIEGARILITKDSVIMMDKIHHTVLRRNTNYLQELLKVPLTFSDLQNILLGNPIFMKGNISSYKHSHNQWFVTIDANTLTNFVTIIDNNRKFFLRHIRLQDSTSQNDRVCDMTFNTHQAVNNYWFSQNRIMQVSDNKTSLQIKIQFKEFHFGEEVSFPFSIPDDYTQK